MKKIFFTTLVIYPLLLLGQPYKSLFTQDKVSSWNIFSGTIPGSTTPYKATRDTFVNGNTWKCFGNEFQTSGILREDTLTGKVWFRGFFTGKYRVLTDTAEKLVCDFSLNVGDSFHYYYHMPLDTIGVKFIDYDTWLKVDSVFYKDSLKHIQFDTVGLTNRGLIASAPDGRLIPFVMIEGVGTPRGFHYMANGGGNPFVQCHYRDTDLFYMSVFTPRPNECYIKDDWGGFDDLKNSQRISVFPNPCEDVVFIISDNVEEQVLYDITDLTGKSLFSGSPSNNKIDVSTLTSGIYFLHIEQGNKYFKRVKFIKL